MEEDSEVDDVLDVCLTDKETFFSEEEEQLTSILTTINSDRINNMRNTAKVEIELSYY